MIRNTPVIYLGLALLTLLGTPLPSAQTKTNARLVPSVLSQRCLTGDDVYVTYTATIDPPKNGILYRWDFNNDGLFDTDPNPDPTASTGYRENAIVVAVVQATQGDRTTQKKIRFRTMNCE